MGRESTSAPPRWVKDWLRRGHSPWPTRPPVMPGPQRRQHFTLLELLVAIGILALLVGFTVKAVRKFRQAAEAAERAVHVQHP